MVTNNSWPNIDKGGTCHQANRTADNTSMDLLTSYEVKLINRQANLQLNSPRLKKN